MVLLPGLAEADSRIEQDPAERHAGAGGEVERAFEETLDIVENVDRRIRLIAVVHDDQGRAGLGDGVGHAGIALQAPDIVDDTGAEPRRLARNRRLGCVDRDRRVKLRAERLERRNHAGKLLGLGNRNMAGPGRFAADIDDRRAFGDHRFGAGDRGPRAGMAPAVGERVRASR